MAAILCRICQRPIPVERFARYPDTQACSRDHAMRFRDQKYPSAHNPRKIINEAEKKDRTKRTYEVKDGGTEGFVCKW
jgi:hypothetical protein